ncbi:MAG: phosphopantetheine-binding protein, partial [Pseudomonadota bacterium]
KIQDGYFTLNRCFTSWSVRIANEDNETLRMGEIGSIQAKSRTRMFKGYCFRDDSFLEDGWFDTGDLGTLTEEGLVLTGRKKSVIIINARKISTEAIEIALAGLAGVKPSLLAALPYRDESSQTDELAVFYTPSTSDPEMRDRLLTEIRATVAKSFGVKVHHVVPIREDQFTRTPSGKIKRDALSAALRAGTLQSAELSASQAAKEEKYTSWIGAKWQQVLKLPAPPRAASNFFEDGGDSLACLELLMAVETHFNCRIALEDFYQSPTVENLSRLTALVVPESHAAGLPENSGLTVGAVMRQMETLIEPWAGPRIGPERLVIGRNLHGRKPPLFWVFQAEREFAALAEHLGEDQPVYGTRSLVGLFRAQEYSPIMIHTLCRRILADLEAICPTDPVALGGNCQGAIIALYLARELRRTGREPDLLVLMEWMFSHGRYDKQTLFLYGENSHTRAAFEGSSSEGPDWRNDFPQAVVDKTAGGHGDFFDPGQIETLAAQLTKHLDAQFSPRVTSAT